MKIFFVVKMSDENFSLNIDIESDFIENQLMNKTQFY